MREILFRGKRLCNNKWMFGSLLCFENGNRFICCNNDGSHNHYKVDPESVGQYTGVKDIHGEKVFEHDLVKYQGFGSISESREIIMRIVFVDGEFLMQPVEKYAFESWPIRVSGERMEVIGNVYDKPVMF